MRLPLTPTGLLRSAHRLGAFAQNALEVARFGGLETGEDPTPAVTVAEHANHRLVRYRPDAAAPGARPPVVLVPPLMLDAQVYDIAPATSAVAALHGHGIDPWVVDFGAPERQEGGLRRTLTDHVLAVSDAVDEIVAATGRDVHLGGYSQGGMFCYQAAAYRRSEGIASLVTFGSPVDTHRAIPLGLPEEPVTRLLSVLAETVLADRSVPSWMSRIGFKLLDPINAVRQQIDFVRQLHDREALAGRERQRRFLGSEGWVAYPGPALADVAEQFLEHNRMLSGGFSIAGRLVTLADVDCPVLCFVGDDDRLAPPAAVRPVVRAAPRAEVFEVSLPTGHFGLVVGSRAVEATWPTVAAWTRWVEGRAARPDRVVPVDPDADDGARGGPNLGHGLRLAGGVGRGLVRSTARAVSRGARTLRGIADAAARQLPVVSRLQGVTRDTRLSLGRLLAEQADRAPEDTFFLFDGRGYSYAEASWRVDNIVRGLVDVGVRRGEHVGVLMDTRPSALALVSAISRLGAVAVLLRPGGALERELALGEVDRVITDPTHAAAMAGAVELPVLVLGMTDGPRELPAGVVDMERIDPAAVSLPAWYTPDPGRAGELAFVVFSGRGEHTRANRITNRRWSLSALGTASAAALDDGDTVYSVTPIHHASGLLVGTGGALAGGCRLALATDVDRDTFWSEVRRYGATVVSYTWTMCRRLLAAPPHAAETHHPIRLFVGSGMPAGLWRRVLERFAPARVLEFYASTEGGAVLANISGTKVGCKGRPIPGSAAVAVVRYDVPAGQLVEGEDGFAQRCDDGEPGMLLSRVDGTRHRAASNPLRGVFEPDDAWVATGDIFTRDADGDHWLVDHADDMIHTPAGLVGSVPVEQALERVPWIELAVVYGLPHPGGDRDMVVAAVVARADDTPDAGRLTAAAGELGAGSRPAVVRLVDDIPTTAWHRPDKAALRAAGLGGTDGRTWVWDGEGYAARDDGEAAVGAVPAVG